jgi:hypothetical protein
MKVIITAQHKADTRQHQAIKTQQKSKVGVLKKRGFQKKGFSKEEVLKRRGSQKKTTQHNTT